MAHTKLSLNDVDPMIPEEHGQDFDGKWWFLKDSLNTTNLGFTILEMDPEENGPEHEHEDQEEIYYVEHGSVEVNVNGETESLTEGEVLKLDAEDTRQITNGDEASRLVLVGAPRDE